MSRFEDAIGVVLAHEGGYVNHPEDPGGATKFGISLRWLRQELGDDADFDLDGDVDAEDVQSLTEEQAKEIYRVHWWDKYGYGRIVSQSIATKVLDLAVNMGARQAHRIVQRALASCGKQVKDDGILGPVTLGAVNGVGYTMLLAAIRSEAAGFYRGLVMRNAALRKHGIKAPDFSVFLKGWLRRAYS